MANISKHILKTQNLSEHVDELLAQRKIYSMAKNYLWLTLVITVLVPILLSFAIILFPKLEVETTWIFALYTVLAAFGEKIIETTVYRLKKLAASIQEEFDTFVLQLDKNEALNTILIDKETIRRFSSEFKKNKDKVKAVTNWYSTEIKGLKTNIATILCQRTNVSYDFSIRKRYNNLVRLLVVFTFVTLLIISLINERSLRAFLIEVILPSIPIFIFAYNEIDSNNESIDNLEHLKSLIEIELNSLHSRKRIDNSLLRSIQNRIYYNRILSPLIHDFIYRILKPKLEDEMNYSIEETVKILNENSS